MLSRSPTRQPGEDFRRKVAAHWGMSYGQLEAISLGEDAPASTSKPLSWRAEDVPPNLAAVIAEYSWMPELPNPVRSVVREQARLYLRFGGTDFEMNEWQRIVTGLEREALAVIARRARTDSSIVPRDERKRTAKLRK
jgi:hypothetical protein